jgi:uncharacterized protein (TIGR02246 family)
MNDPNDHESDIRALYRRVLDGWNRASAEEFAAPFAEDGEVIGFDGSLTGARAEIPAEMARIRRRLSEHPGPIPRSP